MIKKSKSSYVCIAILVCLLVCQCTTMIHYASKKAGYHLDEMLTFSLSNYSEGSGVLTRVAGILEEWNSGNVWRATVKLDADERFSYEIPYQNTEKDVHPHLYYYVIHTFSSLFPTLDPKWIGIIPNIIFQLCTTVCLFALSVSATKSYTKALLVSIGWSMSIGAMSCAVWIRMYAMMTFFCVLLMLIHVRFLRCVADGVRISIAYWLALLICTCAGILTQYYFLIYSFFLCGCTFLFLLLSKTNKKRLAAHYAVAEFGAILVSFLCFPSMYEHIFNGYRGKQAFSSAVSSNTAEYLKEYGNIIDNQLFNGCFAEVFCALALLAIGRRVYICFLKPGHQKLTFPRMRFESGIVWLSAIVSVGYIWVIAKVAPYRVDRYVFPVYPFVMLAALLAVCTAVEFLFRQKKIRIVVVVAFVVFMTIVGYMNQSVNYLYTQYTGRKEISEEYASYPVVVANFATFDSAPTAWAMEFANYDNIFLTKAGHLESLKKATETQNLREGFLLYAVYAKELKDEALISTISEYIPITKWTRLTKAGDHIYLCK